MARNKKIEKLPRIVAGALADAFQSSFVSIDRWAAKGDDRLTSDKAKKVFNDLGFIYEPELYMTKKALAKAV